MSPGSEGKLCVLSARILQRATRWSPAPLRPWGAAMQGEMVELESGWESFRWALGGALALCRSGVVLRLRGARASCGLVLEDAMRAKLPLVGVVVFLALLLSAGFRQALFVPLSVWRIAITRNYSTDATAQKLAETAIRNHDADALAVAALRLSDTQKASELLDQAISWQPGLEWARYAIASRLTGKPEFNAQFERLKAWDPDNAAVYLLEAQNVRQLHGEPPLLEATNDPRWYAAMANAMNASRYDSYMPRLADLQRTIIKRYPTSQPLEVMLAMSQYPLINFINVRAYARETMRNASNRPDTSGSEDVWRLVRFGHLLQTNANSDLERVLASMLQEDAYDFLGKQAEQRGNELQAEHLRMQAQDLKLLMENSNRESVTYIDFLGWSGSAVQVFLAGCLTFAGLLLLTLVCAAWHRWKGRKTGRKLENVATVAGLGLAFSSLALYLVYSPYRALFERFANGKGMDSTIRLLAFDALVGLPRQLMYPQGRIWLWYVVIAIGVAAVIWIVARNVRRVRLGPRTVAA